MSLIFTQNLSKDCIVGLWKLEESHKELLEKLCPTERDFAELHDISHPHKQLEWLASRNCAKALVELSAEHYVGIWKDQHRNPHLIDSQTQISISHTQSCACAVLNKSKPVGVDIEQISEKLRRVAHKFLSEKERIHVGDDLQKMCIYWCAKESIYKWHGAKNLSFKDNIFIHPFEGNAPFDLEGEIHGTEFLTIHQLKVFYWENFVFTTTLD
jgi:4'-phosphopantetheinyl transferase